MPCKRSLVGHSLLDYLVSTSDLTPSILASFTCIPNSPLRDVPIFGACSPSSLPLPCCLICSDGDRVQNRVPVSRSPDGRKPLAFVLQPGHVRNAGQPADADRSAIH